MIETAYCSREHFVADTIGGVRFASVYFFDVLHDLDGSTCVLKRISRFEADHPRTFVRHRLQHKDKRGKLHGSLSSSRKSCHVSDVFLAWAYIYRFLWLRTCDDSTLIHLLLLFISGLNTLLLAIILHLSLAYPYCSFWPCQVFRSVSSFIYLLLAHFPLNINFNSAKYLPFLFSSRFLHFTASDSKSSTIDFSTFNVLYTSMCFLYFFREYLCNCLPPTILSNFLRLSFSFLYTLRL